MQFKDAAFQILTQAGQPLHASYAEGPTGRSLSRIYASPYMFILLHSPGEVPLSLRPPMPLRQLFYRLRNHSFTAGARISDHLAGTTQI
jgi:hypothetical protein